MRAALIPPLPELSRYGTGSFHLLLSHLYEHDEYVVHYAEQRRQGAYLVLDNSAHEFNEGQVAPRLQAQALALNVQEVVVPDVLFNAAKTCTRAMTALEIWYEHGPTMLMLNPALMYVPQGEDEAQWADCLLELLRLHTYMAKKVQGFRKDFVIGVSKDYDDRVPGGLDTLISKYLVPIRQQVHDHYRVTMHIHLLGWMGNLWKLSDLAVKYPFIRSTDSAKPFVYAREGYTLNTDKPVPEYPHRRADYFTTTLDKHQRIAATRNVKVFQRVAEGRL